MKEEINWQIWNLIFVYHFVQTNHFYKKQES